MSVARIYNGLNLVLCRRVHRREVVFLSSMAIEDCTGGRVRFRVPREPGMYMRQGGTLLLPVPNSHVKETCQGCVHAIRMLLDPGRDRSVVTGDLVHLGAHAQASRRHSTVREWHCLHGVHCTDAGDRVHRLAL